METFAKNRLAFDEVRGKIIVTPLFRTRGMYVCVYVCTKCSKHLPYVFVRCRLIVLQMLRGADIVRSWRRSTRWRRANWPRRSLQFAWQRSTPPCTATSLRNSQSVIIQRWNSTSTRSSRLSAGYRKEPHHPLSCGWRSGWQNILPTLSIPCKQHISQSAATNLWPSRSLRQAI